MGGHLGVCTTIYPTVLPPFDCKAYMLNWYAIIEFLLLFVVEQPPTNVSAVVISSRRVRVTWDHSLSSDVTGFFIAYTSYASRRSMMVLGAKTVGTLINLEENTPYNITVQTDSSGTLSSPSGVVSVTTWTAGK